MKLHEFQMVIDRYPMQVEVKGAYVDLSATRHPSSHLTSTRLTGIQPKLTQTEPSCDALSFVNDSDDSFTVFNKLTHPDSWLEAWASGIPQ